MLKYNFSRIITGMSVKTLKMITTRYKISAPVKNSLRIALAADLHDRPGGEVLKRLKQEQPDLILAAGDILERCTEGESQYTKAEMDAWQGLRKKNKIASGAMKTVMKIGYSMHEKHEFSEGIEFLKEASEIAPVFYSPGNHEWYFTKEDQKVFSEKRIFLLENEDICWNLVENRLVPKSECGNNRKAVKDVVNKNYLKVENDSESGWNSKTEIISEDEENSENIIHIGGLATRYDLDWMHAYATKPGYKILICHHPEYYRRYIKDTEWDTFDLIVSGHVHGGQWRIGRHGVLAPGQGLFPKYCYGCYDKKLIVSAGLSNTACVPRFGNPTELVMIDVIAKNKNSGRLGI